MPQIQQSDEQTRVAAVHASHFPLTRQSLLFYLQAATRGQIGSHVSLDRMFREVTKLTGDPCHDRNLERAIALVKES
jgi:hypothetical protein